jgi:His-Xaa-Ser system protein HxsD
VSICGTGKRSKPKAAVRTHETNVDTRLYQILAVKKAAYRIAEKCTIVLESLDGHLLPLTFSFRAGTSDAAVEEAVRLFYQELLDEELRAVIHEETDALRALILAHTFSRTDLIER